MNKLPKQSMKQKDQRNQDFLMESKASLAPRLPNVIKSVLQLLNEIEKDLNHMDIKTKATLLHSLETGIVLLKEKMNIGLIT